MWRRIEIPNNVARRVARGRRKVCSDTSKYYVLPVSFALLELKCFTRTYEKREDISKAEQVTWETRKKKWLQL